MEKMTLLQALILGAVQGMTEFLPISSDGHLVLVQKFFGFHGSMLAFDVMVHFGTLIAILIFFKEILKQVVGHSLKGFDMWRKTGSFQLASKQFPLLRTTISICITFLVTIPLALLIKKFFPFLFDNMTCVAWSWLFTGAALIIGERISEGKTELDQINWKVAILIGIAQALAVLPGVSRSGNTILLALVLGISRKSATQFSFLSAIPVILGAVIFEFLEEPHLLHGNPGVLLSGMFTALVVGYAVIRTLPSLVESGWFFRLGWYLLMMGGFALYWVR